MRGGAFPIISPTLREEIHGRLMALSYAGYCQLVRKLLLRSGYSSIRSMGTGSRHKTVGQGGLDLLAFAHTDLATALTAIQIKRSKEPVACRYVEQLRGVCLNLGAERGLIISANDISPAARKIAAAVQDPPIQLVDGRVLIEMLIDRQLGAISEQVMETIWKTDVAFFDALEGGGDV